MLNFQDFLAYLPDVLYTPQTHEGLNLFMYFVFFSKLAGVKKIDWWILFSACIPQPLLWKIWQWLASFAQHT